MSNKLVCSCNFRLLLICRQEDDGTILTIQKNHEFDSQWNARPMAFSVWEINRTVCASKYLRKNGQTLHESKEMNKCSLHTHNQSFSGKVLHYIHLSNNRTMAAKLLSSARFFPYKFNAWLTPSRTLIRTNRERKTVLFVECPLTLNSIPIEPVKRVNRLEKRHRPRTKKSVHRLYMFSQQ